MTSFQILTNDEIKKFNLPPILNTKEKKYYFTIPNYLLEALDADTNKIHFISVFGYFKATNKFFAKFDNQVYMYIVNNILNLGYDLVNIKPLPKSTFYRYKKIIKDYFKIQTYTPEIARILLTEATELASNFIHRKKIFYELVTLSQKLKIEIPSYTEL